MVYQALHIRIIFLLFLSLQLLTDSKAHKLDSLLVLSGEMSFEKGEFASSVIYAPSTVFNVIQDEEPASVRVETFNPETLELRHRFSWSKTGLEYSDLKVFMVEEWNGNLVFLSRSVNQITNKRNVWLSEINPEGKELITVLIEEEENSREFPLGSYELFKNLESSSLGVSSVKNRNKDSEFEIDIYLLENHLENYHHKELILPNIKKVNYPNTFQLSQNGIVYFLNGLTNEKMEDTGSVGLEKRLYQLFRYDSKEDKIKQYDVSIADKYISDVTMKVHKDGSLYVMGFYNNTYFKGVKGVFIMVIDNQSGTIIKSGKKELDRKIQNDLLTEKQIRKNESIEDLYLDHLFIKEDGNLMLFSEVFYIDQRMITSANSINFTTSKYYNFEEILVMELDLSLNLVNHQVIYKRQKSTNFLSPYWSYTVVQNSSQDQFGLVYNYIDLKNSNNPIVISTMIRTDTWYQPVFQPEKKLLSAYKNLKISPQYNAVINSKTLIFQDKKKYGLLNIKL